MALVERKERLATLLKDAPLGIAYSEHEGGDGQTFGCAACRHGLEGIVSKRTDRRYLPGDRRAWVKSKCLNRGEWSSSDGPNLRDRDTQSARSHSAVGKWVEIGSCALSHPSRRGSRQDATDDLLRRLDHCVLFDDAILDLANEFVAVLYKLRAVRFRGQRLLSKGDRVKPQFADPVPGQVVWGPPADDAEAQAA